MSAAPILRTWFEALLRRRAGPLRIVCGDWVIAVGCGVPQPAEADVAALGELFERLRRYRGPRAMELGLGPRWIQPRVQRIAEAAWTVGDLCVQGSDVLLFPYGHQRLFALLVRLDGLFAPLCSALEVARLPRQTEVCSAAYRGETAREAVSAPGFWRSAAETVWPKAELLAPDRWRRETPSGDAGWTVERLAEQVLDTETRMGISLLVAIIVDRDAQGHIARCFMAFVRPSLWRGDWGSVLMFAYVGRHSRRTILH